MPWGRRRSACMSLDRRARTYDLIAPRTDPVMDAIFKKYWAFHNPLWPRTIGRPAGEVFLLDSLIPRKDFVATPFFNEWMRPAGFSIASMGANLLVGNEISTMISVANAPGKDEITGEQMLVFKAALPHIDRAVRIHRELKLRDIEHYTAPDRLECLPRGVMLVDGASRVVFANAAARALLNSAGRARSRGRLPSRHGRFGRSSARIDRLLQAQCPHAKRSRRGNFDSHRPEPITACHGDATAGQRHRRRTSLARLANSPGHCHGIHALDGEITQLTAGMSPAGQRVQIAHHGFHPLVEHMGIDLRR